jgi:hypothetical protein
MLCPQLTTKRCVWSLISGTPSLQSGPAISPICHLKCLPHWTQLAAHERVPPRCGFPPPRAVSSCSPAVLPPPRTLWSAASLASTRPKHCSAVFLAARPAHNLRPACFARGLLPDTERHQMNGRRHVVAIRGTSPMIPKVSHWAPEAEVHGVIVCSFVTLNALMR